MDSSVAGANVSVRSATPSEDLNQQSPWQQSYVPESKDWDEFTARTSDHEPEEDSSNTCLQVLRLVTCLVVFAVVLTSVTLGSGTLLLAASNLRLPANHTTCADPSFDGTCVGFRVKWGWSLFIMVCAPYVFVAVRNLNRIFREKKARKSRINKFSRGDYWRTLALVMVVETMHAVGIAIFVFILLPAFDNVVEGLLATYGLAFGPSVMAVCFRYRRHREKSAATTGDDDTSRHMSSCLNTFVDIVAVIFQASLVAILIFLGVLNKNVEIMWSVPVAIFLTSFRYWENYIGERARVKCLTGLYRWLRDLSLKTREWKVGNQLIASVWKIVLTFCLMPWLVTRHMKYNFNDSWRVLFDSIKSVNCTSADNGIALVMELDWLWVSLIQVSSGLVCYFFARSASKMLLQRISYALPLTLSTPITYAVLTSMCYFWNRNPCTYNSVFPGYLFFKCLRAEDKTLVYCLLSTMLALWILAELITTRHVWQEQSIRLARSDRLFVLPLYDVFVQHSLLINNRKYVRKFGRGKQVSTDNNITRENRLYRDLQATAFSPNLTTEEKKSCIPMIYICATMWHEAPDEMETMLKSVYNLDEDQHQKRNEWWKQKVAGNNNSDANNQWSRNADVGDYYEFEAHVFFDNAMESVQNKPDKNKSETASSHGAQLNTFVKDLITTVKESASTFCNCDIGNPAIYATPYGGRLKWIMKHGNKLIVHLKDSALIRQKKRWSQVMYMYYFLGFKLKEWQQGQRTKKSLTPNSYYLKTDNTFLLALDGDIDFKPTAVTMLVDLMKRDLRVGAACGRIHPTGSGPLVWYQSFEYALGHWMQKATEHVIGCVLCSPGCFSLFRGSALMSGAMRTYTRKATEPQHYVQYDQGEDRWLCTLLLQQGDRVEYCAASNSYTKAPEAFKEFFNQRRRWIPSTMANIADLLGSWRITTRVNENISKVYILYQVTMFVVTIFGPGTIFMLMTGALQLALNRVWPSMSFMDSFLINLAPVVIFILLCFFAKADTQIWFAYLLSFIYCVVQILVLIGIVVPMFQVTPIYCNINALFFFYTAGTFILCGLLHPHELLTLAQGFVYYIAIPTMYLILMLYAICNLNVISWGTREAKAVKQKPNPSSKQDESAVLSSDGLLGRLATRTSDLLGVQSTNTGCCKARCGCCPPIQLQVVVNPQVAKNTTDPMSTRFIVDGERLTAECKQAVSSGSTTNASSGENDVNKTQQTVTSSPKDETSTERTSWLKDPFLQKCKVYLLKESEETFFEGLIAKYLEPESRGVADKDAVEERDNKIKKELLDMRNRTVFGFLTINIAFVITLLVLQSYTADVFGVEWLPGKCNHNTNSSSYDVSSGSKIEPVGLAFLFLFGTILLIQTLGMIAHRLGTFLHVIAITTLNFRLRWRDDYSAGENRGNEEDNDNVDDDEVQVRSSAQSIRRKRMSALSFAARSNEGLDVKSGGTENGDISKATLKMNATHEMVELTESVHNDAYNHDNGAVDELEANRRNLRKSEVHFEEFQTEESF